jgi:amidophosphoribosyltransferase
LLAANLTVDEIREYLEVESLTYLRLDHLLEATGTVGAGFCDACLTGTYPIEIPVNLSKAVLEGPEGISAPERTMPIRGDDGEAELPTEAANRLFGRGS